VAQLKDVNITDLTITMHLNFAARIHTSKRSAASHLSLTVSQIDVLWCLVLHISHVSTSINQLMRSVLYFVEACSGHYRRSEVLQEILFLKITHSLLVLTKFQTSIQATSKFFLHFIFLEHATILRRQYSAFR